MAVYSVKTSKGLRLVEARTSGAARNHIMKDEVEVKTLNTSDLVKYINEGLKIETVKEDAADPAAPAADATKAAGEPAKASEQAKPAADDKSPAKASDPAANAAKEEKAKAGFFKKTA